MNHISNIEVHLKTRSGNVNIAFETPKIQQQTPKLVAAELPLINSAAPFHIHLELNWSK